jgi:hypothetical protein
MYGAFEGASGNQLSKFFLVFRFLGFFPVALQDLVASKDSVAQDVIEGIITGFVKLDPDPGLVLFTPESTRLPVRPKVLVYLVALQAWPLLNPRVSVPSEASSSEIAERTCIGVGKVRHALKELEKQHLITWGRFWKYFVCEQALPIIKVEIDAARKALGK